MVGVDAEMAAQPESTFDFRLSGAADGYREIGETAFRVEDRCRKQQELREHVFCSGPGLDRTARQAMEPRTGHPRTRRRRIRGLGLRAKLLEETGECRRSGSTSGIRFLVPRGLDRVGRRD